jgi:hypothetical protein
MIEYVELSMSNLPPEFSGVRIAVLADLHAGMGRNRQRRLERIVEMTNDLQPDHLVILGDTLHHPRQAPRYRPLLAKLTAREGKWAILGNHEHKHSWYSSWLAPQPLLGTEQWEKYYDGLGMELLVNESVAVTRGGARMWLVGLDDPYSGHADLERALRGTDAADFRLVLTHSPDAVDHPRSSDLDLFLAGHTHGGQIRLPGGRALYAPCRHPRLRAAGLVHVNGTTLYVSRGTGEGLPFRLNCPSEVTLLTLHSNS